MGALHWPALTVRPEAPYPVSVMSSYTMTWIDTILHIFSWTVSFLGIQCVR